MTSQAPAGDPIGAAVVRAALASTAREVFSQFVRTALTPTIYEAHDFSVAVFDDEVNVVADASGLPEYVGSLAFTVERLVQRFGQERFRPGDVLASSDPFITGGHPPDVAVVSPAFCGDRLIGFCALRGHVGDVGARNDYPADARTVYEEGLVLPPMRLVDRGEFNEDIATIVAANSRMPRETIGNMRSAVGATSQGARKLARIVETHGEPTYRRAITDLLDGSEMQVREMLAAIPDGEYYAYDKVDETAVDDGEIALVCCVRINGSEIEVDVTGSDPVHEGALNVPLAQTVAACRLALKRLTTQDSVPANSGEYRPLHVIAPEGTIFNARRPVGTFMMHVTASLLSEMIVTALLPAISDRAPAQTSGHTTAFTAGIEHGGRHMSADDMAAIGYGAQSGRDGTSALEHFSIAGIPMASAEVWESRAPVLKRRAALVADSGGPGRWRGGLGTRVEWTFDADAVLTLQSERTGEVAGSGLEGGLPGGGRNDVEIAVGTADERALGMSTDVLVKAGQGIVLHGAGGGGFGDPLQRDVDAVLRDVRRGYVSIEGAHEQYGVVVDPTNMVVDHEATAGLRSR